MLTSLMWKQYKLLHIGPNWIASIVISSMDLDFGFEEFSHSRCTEFSGVPIHDILLYIEHDGLMMMKVDNHLL